MPGDTSYIVVDRGARNQIDRTTAQPDGTRTAGQLEHPAVDSVERAGAAAG